MAIHCCKGMAYLHNNNIIHRDLKTHNLLVDQEWKVKVSDFGLSRVIDDTYTAQTLTACGTPSWAAPEVLKDQRYSAKADVYSFGMCLWEMCTREDPYMDLTAPQVVIFVAVKGKRPDIPVDMQPEFAVLIRDSWQENPEARPEFSTIIDTLEAIVLPLPLHPAPYEPEDLIATTIN